MTFTLQLINKINLYTRFFIYYKVLIIGHRGCSYEPENTLISFEKALALNVDMIELDVHKCKSGEIVVIHDESVDRTTNGHGKVKELSFQELKKLNCEKMQKIPKLEEVFDLIDKKCKVNIELKGIDTGVLTGKIIEKYVSKGWDYEDFLVSSRNYIELNKLFYYNKNIPRGVILFIPQKNFMNHFKYLTPSAVCVNFIFARPYLIEQAHNYNVEFFVWTVNNKKTYERMKKLGVDGVFSNYPDKLIA